MKRVVRDSLKRRAASSAVVIPSPDNKTIARRTQSPFHLFTYSPIYSFIHSFCRWQNCIASYPSVVSCVSCVKWHSPNLNLNISFFLTIFVCLKTCVTLCATRDRSAYPYPYSYCYSYSYMLMQSSPCVCECANVCTAFVCARELLEIYLHAFNWHSSGGDQRQPPPVVLPGYLPG